jgi:hypothetical protein
MLQSCNFSANAVRSFEAVKTRSTVGTHSGGLIATPGRVAMMRTVLLAVLALAGNAPREVFGQGAQDAACSADLNGESWGCLCLSTCPVERAFLLGCASLPL